MSFTIYDVVFITLVTVICFVAGMIFMELVQFFIRKRNRDKRRKKK